MPITKSAKKALRQSKRRQTQNLKRAEEYKDAIGALKKLLGKKEKKEALALLPKVYQKLDKATKTRVIEKNKAARLKARLAQAINKLS